MGLFSKAKGLFGGGTLRVQNCMLLTEYSEILDIALPVKKGLIVREEKEVFYESWGLDIGNQVKDTHFGYMQVISERDTAPVPLWHETGKTFTKNLLHAIAEASLDIQLLIINKKAQKERLWMLITIVVVVLGICALLIVGTRTVPQLIHRG